VMCMPVWSTDILVDRNCFGDQHLFVANGTLDIGYDWWGKTQVPGRCENCARECACLIPGEASFHVLATTDDGNVASDFYSAGKSSWRLRAKIDTVVTDPPGPSSRFTRPMAPSRSWNRIPSHHDT